MLPRLTATNTAKGHLIQGPCASAARGSVGAGKAYVIPEWTLDQHHPQNTKERGPPRPHPGPPVLTSQAPMPVHKGIPRRAHQSGQWEPLQKWLIVAGEAPHRRRGTPLGRERVRPTRVRDRSTSGRSWGLPGSPAAVGSTRLPHLPF